MKPYARDVKGIINTALENGAIARWASAGATDKQIAESLGISFASFTKQKAQNLQIVETIQRARKPVVLEAFNGLVKLSQGYHETTTKKHKKVTTYPDGSKKIEEEVVEEDVYVQPQTQACSRVIMNYLKQNQKGGGVPSEYISEAQNAQQGNIKSEGNYTELETAMKALFFGGSDEH